MTTFIKNERVEVEWMPNDWREAIVEEVYSEDKIWVALSKSTIKYMVLISSGEIRKIQTENNKFFWSEGDFIIKKKA